MNLADDRRLRIFTLCVLYVAQGIPWGFMATTLPGYLTERGLDFGFISATLSFTYLPYSFKWVWGPIIDMVQLPRFGRRRPWIILAQSLMALTIAAMVGFDVATEIKLLAWMVFLHTVFNALQDVAVDALAVDLLDDEERGRANGLMYGCKYGGGLLGGYGMAVLISNAGIDTALIAQTTILLVIMLVPLFVRERAGNAPAREPVGKLVGDLAQAFSLRSALMCALVMLGMNAAYGMLSATGYQLFIGKLGWEYKQYSAIAGGWGLVVGGVAAAITGRYVDRLGRRAVAAAGSIGIAVGWLVFALLNDHWTARELVWASGLYTTGMSAIMSVALISMCMDLSWERVGGSQFTAYMALSNFSTVLGQQFAPRANELWEFEGVYLAATVFQLAVTPLLLAVDPTELRRKLPLSRVNRLGIAAVLVLVTFLVVMTIRASAKYL